MIFQSLPLFLIVYLPLVILSVFAIIYEEKLIKFEQQIKERVWNNTRRKRKHEFLYVYSTTGLVALKKQKAVLMPP